MMANPKKHIQVQCTYMYDLLIDESDVEFMGYLNMEDLVETLVDNGFDSGIDVIKSGVVEIADIMAIEYKHKIIGYVK